MLAFNFDHVAARSSLFALLVAGCSAAPPSVASAPNGSEAASASSEVSTACAPAAASLGRVEAFVREGRLDSAARRLDALAKEAAECGPLAEKASALGLRVLSDLGRCDELDALPATLGGLAAARQTCATRRSDGADALIRAGRDAIEAGDSARAQRAFDRALAALERETSNRAELLPTAAPHGVVFSTASGVTMGSGPGGWVFSGSPLRWTVVPSNPGGRIAGISADGLRAVVEGSGGYEGRDGRTGAKLWAMKADFGLNLKATYSADSRRALLWSDREFRLVDTANGNVLAKRSDKTPSATEDPPFFSKNGRYIVHPSASLTSLFDAETGKRLARDDVGQAKFVTTPDGGFAIKCAPASSDAASPKGVLVVYDLEKGTIVSVSNPCATKLPIEPPEGGRYLVVHRVGADDYVLDLRNGQRLKEVPAEAETAREQPALAPSKSSASAPVWDVIRLSGAVAGKPPLVVGSRAVMLPWVGIFDPIEGEKIDTGLDDPRVCPRFLSNDVLKSVRCPNGEPVCDARIPVKHMVQSVSLAPSCAYGALRMGQKLSFAELATGRLMSEQLALPRPTLGVDWPRSAATGASVIPQEKMVFVLFDDSASALAPETGEVLRRVKGIPGNAKAATEAGVFVYRDGRVKLIDWEGKETWSHELSFVPDGLEATGDVVVAVKNRSRAVALVVPSGEVLFDTPFGTSRGRLGDYLVDDEGDGEWRYLGLTKEGRDAHVVVGKAGVSVLRGEADYAGRTGFDGRAVMMGNGLSPLACRFGQVHVAFDVCSGRFKTKALAEEP